MLNSATLQPTIGFSKNGPFDGPNPCFAQIQQQAEACPWRNYSSFFDQNRQQIAARCRGRNAHAYRTDQQGCRWENHSPAQTQVLNRSDTGTTIQAGENRLTINKVDSSVRIQNADGTEDKLDLKFWGDPHVTERGTELGTIKKDVMLRLKDGTQVSLLMGDGNGGKPQPGAPDYVDTVAIRSPDGTGALVTGVSGPGKLGVTPLDSSLSSEFIAGQAMNRFGQYDPSHVAVNRSGNLVDQFSGEVIHDQNGLDRLDQHQGRHAAAQSLMGHGYVPRDLADLYDQSMRQYTQDMQQACMSELQRLLQQYRQMVQQMPALAGMLGMPLARYGGQGLQDMAMPRGLSA